MRKLSVYDLVRDCESSRDFDLSLNSVKNLIEYMGNSFLELSKDDILYVISYLEKATIIKDIIDGNYNEFDDDIRNLFILYLNYIIPIKLFINMSVKDDIIVNALLDCRIKDFELFKHIISNYDINYLSVFFDGEIDCFLDFLFSIDGLSEYGKIVTIRIIFDKISVSKERYFSTIYNIINGKYKDNSIIKKIFDSDFLDEFYKIVVKNGTCNKSLMEYIIASGYSDSNFLDNYNHLYKDNVIEYDYITSCDLLRQYFNGDIKIDKDTLKNIVRAIMTSFLNDNGICDVRVIFDNAIASNRGSFNCTSNMRYIFINNCLLDAFLDDSLVFSSRIRLFNTMFHEMRHAIQDYKARYNSFDYDVYIMLKEDIIMEYGDPNYYSDNYRLFKSEIDARNHGYLDSMEFLYTNFPVLRDRLDSLKVFPLYDYDDYNIKNFSVSGNSFDFEVIFDKLVLFDPSIIKKYPILELEYNKDGTLKSFSDLINNLDNSIVRGILTNRYKYKELLDSIMYARRRV